MNEPIDSTILLLMVIGIVVVLFAMALILNRVKPIKKDKASRRIFDPPPPKRSGIFGFKKTKRQSAGNQNDQGSIATAGGQNKLLPRLFKKKAKQRSNHGLTNLSKISSKSKQGTWGQTPLPRKEQLERLAAMVSKEYSDFTTRIKSRHIMLEKNGEPVVMLTIDPATDIGHRKLGEVEVVNFHTIPSVMELKIELMGL